MSALFWSHLQIERSPSFLSPGASLNLMCPAWEEAPQSSNNEILNSWLSWFDLTLKEMFVQQGQMMQLPLTDKNVISQDRFHASAAIE